jgi:hypothetical protein
MEPTPIGSKLLRIVMLHPDGKLYNNSYGEARIKAIDDANIIKGEAIIKINNYLYGPKMSKKEAGKYYNEKLRCYWLENLDKRIPFRKRNKILRYLLGELTIGDMI